MKYLLDVNGLVALGFLQHEFHERVASWVHTLASRGVPELATCSITELGFVRVLAQAPQYGFTIANARILLLRLKTGNSPKFTFIPDDHDVSHIPAWVRLQNKLPTAISHNSPRRRAQFLPRWMKGYPGHS